MKLPLPVRFWRAVPSRNPDGHVPETRDIVLTRVCFVTMRVPNSCCTGGPPVPEEFWVDLGSPQSHAADWEIMVNKVAPSLAAALAAGLKVVHIQLKTIGNKYPESQTPRTVRAHHDAATIPTQKPGSRGPISDHATHRAERVHGAGFGSLDSWKVLDFAETMRSNRSESVLVADDQCYDWLRARGIDTLICVGFCTNLCILEAPCGLRCMAPRGSPWLTLYLSARGDPRGRVSRPPRGAHLHQCCAPLYRDVGRLHCCAPYYREACLELAH